MKRSLSSVGIALILAFVAGCASSPNHPNPSAPQSSSTPGQPSLTVSNQLSPDLLKPSAELFTLGPGDVVEIEIVGSPTSRTTTAVGPDGKIYYYLLPGQDVWGLTLTQTRDLLERQLTKYLTQPQVAVNLRAIGSKHVWILGRLNRPGIYPIAGALTLLEALSLAGGTARSGFDATTIDLADLRHSFVVRQGQFLPVDFYRLLREGDTSQNIFLQPDDFVFVPSALEQEVYVLGAVKAPRAISYIEDMTLVSAVANGSGPEKFYWLAGTDTGPMTRDAYLSHVAILRGSLSAPTVTVVDYAAIIKGRAPDVRLEPGDIIYVPNSPYVTIKRYVNIILNTFVTTVAANEGIRAGGGTVGVGVSVPVGK